MIRLRVIEILKEQGKTKYWLYNKLETISYTNFDNMIKNKTKSIRYEMIEKICRLLKCKPSDLFEFKNDDK